MNSKTLIATTLGMLVAGTATAQSQPATGLNYTFLEGGLSVIDIDERGFSETEAGYNFRGSLDLVNGFYLQGSLDQWEVDVGPFDVDTDLLKLGGGYRHSLQPDTDLFVEASYSELEVGSEEQDGLRSDVGVRSDLGGGIEARAFGGILADGSDAEGILGADLLYKFNRNLGFSVGAETFEFDTNIFRANARVSF